MTRNSSFLFHLVGILCRSLYFFYLDKLLYPGMVWALEPTVKREEEMMDTRIGRAGLSDREACSTAQKQCLYTVAQADRVIVLNK